MTHQLNCSLVQQVIGSAVDLLTGDVEIAVKEPSFLRSEFTTDLPPRLHELLAGDYIPLILEGPLSPKETFAPHQDRHQYFH